MYMGIRINTAVLKIPDRYGSIRDAAEDDLRDTLADNREHCVGMAANMIGIRKRIIIANMGMGDIIMFNPVITKKDSPYDTEESCLSLIGTRKTKRYKNIEVEYTDGSLKEISAFEYRSPTVFFFYLKLRQL